MVVVQLPRLGKRELICLLLFTCGCVVSVWRGFFFLWVHGTGYVITVDIRSHAIYSEWQTTHVPEYFGPKGFISGFRDRLGIFIWDSKVETSSSTSR